MHTRLIEGERVHSIVGAFYTVYEYFSYGLNENVYSGSLAIELSDRGHEVVRELAVEVCYKRRHVAWQRLDLVVDNKVIVEVKTGAVVPPFGPRQLVAYLHATPFEVGVLLHFGPQPKFLRYVDYPKKPR